jgi:hypothetical protein
VTSTVVRPFSIRTGRLTLRDDEDDLLRPSTRPS